MGGDRSVNDLPSHLPHKRRSYQQQQKTSKYANCHHSRSTFSLLSYLLFSLPKYTESLTLTAGYSLNHHPHKHTTAQFKMSVRPPNGIYVPVPTFFLLTPPSPVGSYRITPQLDLPTQASHALHLARSGIKGLVLLGSTGEAIALSSSERTQIISHVRGALTGAGFADYPLIAGTARQDVDGVVEELAQAKNAGAGWGLCLAPGYFAGCASQEGVLEWFRSVAGASALPIMV